MARNITWWNGHNANLNIEDVTAILGADTVAAIRAHKYPECYCECRASGYFDACEREYYAAYRSLAAILSDEWHAEEPQPRRRRSNP